MKLSPEERIERKREHQELYRQNRTEEQKKKLKEYQKRYRQNMTEEQKNNSPQYKYHQFKYSHLRPYPPKQTGQIPYFCKFKEIIVKINLHIINYC